MSYFKKQRSVILQIFILIAIMGFSHILIQTLPPLPARIIGFLLQTLWWLFGGTIAIFFTLQVVLNFRFERTFIPKNLRIDPLKPLQQFTILNPLDKPGSFKKAQLHTHSSLSYDSKTPARQVIESYQRDGYQIVSITDHDRLADFSALSTPDCLVLPGIEVTVPILCWPIPLGKHLIEINPIRNRLPIVGVQQRLKDAKEHNSLSFPAHLSWRGGAGSGRWYPSELFKLNNLQFIEIYSPHSNDPVDLTIWHQLNVKYGPNQPIWGIAVDDSHTGSTNLGWIMVKTERLDYESFMSALNHGAFYASSGPSLAITVTGDSIHVKSPEAKWIKFINAQNQVIAVFRDNEATYRCYGDEGFVRVEAVAPNERTAWSQPMWLIEA